MARTWSYAKRVDDLSAAEKARNRPSSLHAFTALLIFSLLLFGGLVFYTFYHTLRHPITEITQPSAQAPKED